MKGQVKVYTNETLRGADGGEAPPRRRRRRRPRHRLRARLRSLRRPPGAKPAAPPQPTPRRTKSSGATASRAARDALKRSQTFADALQTQINGLYTEFVNMSDPAQRAVIEQKRLAAIAEQDRVKADIAKQTKALADIEDEARRANVPAGWLR